MKKRAKKLTVTRETVRPLCNDVLGTARGGVRPIKGGGAARPDTHESTSFDIKPHNH